jgi:hypothetical protein
LPNYFWSGSACNPIVFESMVMSIVLANQEKIFDLEYCIQDALWRETGRVVKPKKTEDER